MRRFKSALSILTIIVALSSTTLAGNIGGMRTDSSATGNIGGLLLTDITIAIAGNIGGMLY